MILVQKISFASFFSFILCNNFLFSSTLQFFCTNVEAALWLRFLFAFHSHAQKIYYYIRSLPFTSRSASGQFLLPRPFAVHTYGQRTNLRILTRERCIHARACILLGELLSLILPHFYQHHFLKLEAHFQK